MGNVIFIMGGSGSGKSRSIKTLPPDETVLINCIGKDLPFKGFKKLYPLYDKVAKVGNQFQTRKSSMITTIMKDFVETNKKIKYLVLDDLQYVSSFEYMERAKERGFDKFAEIGKNLFDIVNVAKSLREDLFIFFLMHTEETYTADGNRITKVKTIGKMIDNTITLEGLATIVLQTDVIKKDDGTFRHVFVTHNNGNSTVKSPEEMFVEDYIDNDLFLVVNAIKDYGE